MDNLNTTRIAALMEHSKFGKYLIQTIQQSYASTWNRSRQRHLKCKHMPRYTASSVKEDK